MKKVTHIFEDTDLDIFKEKCGFFLEGDKGLLSRNNRPPYSSDYRSLERQINLGLFISEVPEGELDNASKHLKENISYYEAQIKDNLKRIEDYKQQIKVRKNALSILKESKTFFEFFINIIK